MKDDKINKIIGDFLGYKADSPNYCEDLNEMHTAERLLIMQVGAWQSYLDHLNKLCPVFSVAHASARKKATAFTMAIGKFEREPDLFTKYKI